MSEDRESGSEATTTDDESPARVANEDDTRTQDESPARVQTGDVSTDGDETDVESLEQSIRGSEATELDEAAESFVELEQEIGHLTAETARGHAIDVGRVSSSEVPADFPYDIDTVEALALRLRLTDSGEKTITTYFEWPGEGGPDERLEQLLEITDISPDRFADLHGSNILLTVENGHYVPHLPAEGIRGDPRAFYGILAGIAPSVTIALFSFFGLGSIVTASGFFLLWVLCTFILLPISIYVDAWHLRTTTDWDGGPLFWAFFSVIPAINVIAVPAYLIIRESAEPII